MRVVRLQGRHTFDANLQEHSWNGKAHTVRRHIRKIAWNCNVGWKGQQSENVALERCKNGESSRFKGADQDRTAHTEW